MDIKFSKDKVDEFLYNLSKEYDVFAPIAFKGEGRYSDVDSIRYGKINFFDEVVYDRRSDYSAKEVLLPINHLYGVKMGKQVIKVENKEEKKKIIILRACDIHAMERIDEKFLADDYYRNRRKNVKFMLLECPKSFDDCYCLSTETNKTENYSMAISFREKDIFIKVKDSDFNKYITGDFEETNFDVKFATENEITVNKPNIETWDNKTFTKIREMEFWNEYKNRCIGCGSCNASCPTCTCLTKKEVKVEGSELVEIRRIWNGCQLVKSSSLKGYTLKEVVPARIRQRVLDKFYMPKTENSKEQLCVGCGRCTKICPRYISFANTVNRLSEELQK